MFRSIPNWEGQYSVSKDGRVYSHKSHKELKQTTNAMGYPVVTLNNDYDRCTTTVPVHRLVALTFLGIPEGLVVCHTDGNPKNNDLSNLRVDTMKANSLDTVRHGRAGRRSKLSTEDIKNIREDTRPNQVIATEYDISANYVYSIKTRRRAKLR